MNIRHHFSSPLLLLFAVVTTLTITLHTKAFSAATEDPQVLNKEITIHFSDASVETALSLIASAAQIRFAYSLDQLNVRHGISVQADNRTLREVLDEIFIPLNIRYKVHDNEGVISLKRITGRREKEQTLNNQTEYLPEKPAQITGTITDQQQQPMPGVNIIVKGTTRGTSSDADGHYTIAAEEGDVLVFSFIGYRPQEVAVTGRSIMDVVLEEDILSLDEVVVNAGYWKVSEREQTGSISRVTADDISRQPVNNPLQALQGRMTGVYIQQNTGVPGGGFNIQIRGRNSLRDGTGGTINGNLPLYIIDGVPFTSSSLTSPFISGSNLGEGNPLSTINPADIESIEVLKDADATSIYGSRGANGVVLITTKKAQGGKTQVTFDLSGGSGAVSNMMKLLNTSQYLTMRKEALQNDGYDFLLEDPSYDVYWPDLKLWDTTRHTNWQRKLIGGKARITNAQLSLTGGNSSTQFSFGGGYYRESTVFPDDNAYQRASGRFNMSHSTTDNRFRLTVSLAYTSSLSRIPTLDFTGLAVTLAPDAPALFDDHGNLNWENGTWINPLSYLERKYENTTSNLVTNTSLGYTIAKGLSAHLSLGYTAMQVKENSIDPLSAINPQDLAGRTGSAGFHFTEQKTWIVEPQLDYVTKVSKGDLTLLAGSTFQESIMSGETLQATGYTNDALLNNPDAAAGIDVINSNYTRYRYAAFFARANYNWSDKYIVNITGRRDGSSRFGPGKRFATFGAIGAAWIFSNEPFMNSIAWLSFGKLRASYGSTGNDAIGNYQYLSTYAAAMYPYNNSAGLVLSRLSNPDYSWETNRKTEGAIDLGFVKDRVMLSAAYYRNRSSDQLVGFPLPAMTGQQSVQYNLPATVENRGWEFALTTMNVKSRSFEWSTALNITVPDNELISFPDLEDYPAYNSRYDVGKSVFIYKALAFAGVNPTTGVYTFQDVDGSGTISPNGDRRALKKVTQEFYGGISNTFRWNGIQLDIFFQVVKQTGFAPARYFTFPGDFSNQPSVVMQRWRQAGDVTSVQRFTAFDPDGTVTSAFAFHNLSDDAVTDASFIRLKNISLSWQLPGAWMEKIKITGSRLYVQGQNVLTFTRYKGPDPETQSPSLPPLRMITAGIQITL